MCVCVCEIVKSRPKEEKKYERKESQLEKIQRVGGRAFQPKSKFHELPAVWPVCTTIEVNAKM